MAAAVWLSSATVSAAFAQSVHVELLSKNPPGVTPAGGSRGPWSKAISADGRFVVFQSAGPDLVPGQVDANRDYDVFLLDREANATRLVSHRTGHAGEAANTGSSGAVLSGNGRFVAFVSAATNLVGGAANAVPSADVFLYDGEDGSIRRIPRLQATGSAYGNWAYPVGVSDTGWVMFFSESADFVADDTPYSGDVFQYDPVTGKVRLVSHVPGEPGRRPAEGYSSAIDMSRDGRWIVFDSWSMLDASLPATGYSHQVFLYDRESDTSRLVSRNAQGAPGNGYSEAVALTPDGKFVLFRSSSSNLSMAPDSNEAEDAFVFERATGEVHSLSVGVPFADGRAPAATYPVGISNDGRRVLLRREIGPPIDIIGPFEDYPYDHAYVVDRDEGTVRLVTHVDGDPAASIGGVEVLGISGDGSSIIYSSSTAPSLDVVDDNRALDVFLYDVASDRARLVSGVDGSQRAPHGATPFAQISADASLVLLHSTAVDLISGLADNNNAGDMFVHDLRTGRVVLCGRSSGLVESTGMSGYQYGAAVTPDGSGVAVNGFGLVPARADDRNHASEPFYIDRERPAVVPLAPRTPSGFGETHVEKLADRTAVLTSSEVRLGDALVDTNYGYDVFIAALDGTGVPQLVSRSATEAGRTANGRSWPRGVTPSGRHVLFQSHATDLVQGVADAADTDDVFVFDRQANAIDLVSSRAGNPAAAVGGVDASAISDDGRWVLVKASSPAMVQGANQADGFGNVYLIDREAGAVRLVSHSADDPLRTGAGHSTPVALTPDGRWVLYTSGAPDLVAGQSATNGHRHVYLYDRESGQTRLISHQPSEPLDPVDGNAWGVAISHDGRRILFNTDATGLTPAQDFNNFNDAYLHDVPSGTHTLVSFRSHEQGRAAGDNRSNAVAMSGDGRRVLLTSKAADLVSGVTDLNRGEDAFLFDLTLDRIVLLSASVRSPHATANARSYGVAMTADGTGVLLSSEASDLTGALDVNRQQDVFFAEIDFGPVFASGFEGGGVLH
jgi:Tol biopolymer transport system component